MSTFLFRELTLGSYYYQEAKALRLEVLVNPFGIDPAEATRDDATAHHFAVFENRNCLAALLLCPRTDRTLQMRQVAVQPSRQRQGLGKRLVTLSEEWATRQEYRLIWANIRESAEPFYRHLRYEIGAERFKLVGLEHRRAEKIIFAT